VEVERVSWWRRLAAVSAAAAVVLVAPAPARAASSCDQPAGPSPESTAVPIEDQIYAPKQLAPLATGAGVRVAVIDSGVDATHPQLLGRVDRGVDYLHGNRAGRQDDKGHGTGVASIIAAAPADDIGFQGLAPGATIVPIRLTEESEIDGKTVGQGGSPAQFAAAIDWAVTKGRVQVINLSLVTSEDSTAVEQAVKRAYDAGVVVVAAAGNHGDTGNPDPYPAKYPEVLAVGAVTADGVKTTFTQHGDYVDLAAVGKDVTMAARGGGLCVSEGTSFSAPFVTATVALLEQRFPGITPAEVERRLKATADPAPGGVGDPYYGAGLLNPYRALTETLNRDGRPASVPVLIHVDDPAAAALAHRRDRAQRRALLIGAAGAGVVLLIGGATIVIRQGRRRGWRPPSSDVEPTH
jgi:membrane-anchored mycosin MYCP